MNNFRQPIKNLPAFYQQLNFDFEKGQESIFFFFFVLQIIIINFN